MMSTNKSKQFVVFSAIVISSFLAIAGSIGVSDFQALGQQNVTSMSNQTGAATNQTGAATNQTGGTPANMTAASLEPVTNSINEARAALQSNDTAAALEALNEADSQLFAITSSQPAGGEEAEDEGEGEDNDTEDETEGGG
jgi:DNA-binding MurR/RpiR family transcriptional regulator